MGIAYRGFGIFFCMPIFGEREKEGGSGSEVGVGYRICLLCFTFLLCLFCYEGIRLRYD